MRCIWLAARHADLAPASEGHMCEVMACNLCSAWNIYLGEFAWPLMLDRVTMYIGAEVIGNEQTILITAGLTEWDIFSRSAEAL